MIKKYTNILTAVLLIFSILILSSTIYTLHLWQGIYFEQIIINLQHGALQVSSNLLKSYTLYAILPGLLFAGLIIAKIRKTRYLLLIALLSILISAYKLQMFDYILNRHTFSELYATEYTAPEDIAFAFPKQKRNLIVLYLESLEKNYADPALTGENLLPNLTKTAAENITFSGYHQIAAQDYTIAGLIMSQCGIPLKLLPTKDYAALQNFLPSVTCYPQILKQHGYRNYFMKGAPLYFTRTGLFMQTHGFDEVYGTDEIAQHYNLDPQAYQGTSWGFRDSMIYTLAKQKLLEISKEDTPFLLAVLSLDMHEPDIYLDKQCLQKYGDKRDVVLCADKMAHDFISWIQQQDFYPNTTIMIVGDHTETGTNKFYPQAKEREIINIIINPAADIPAANDHQWTMLDLAPTTLQALGIGLPNDAFGLGRSLFAGKATLLEKVGKSLDNELKKSSKEYNKFNKIKYTFKEKNYVYPKWNTEVNTIDDIKKYASVGDELFNTYWLDTLSFTLPETNAENIKFDVWFRILFMENNVRNIEVFANKEKIDDWQLQDKIKQPIRKILNIPTRLLDEKRRLLLEFKSDNIGYTPISVGLGIDKFQLSED